MFGECETLCLNRSSPDAVCVLTVTCRRRFLLRQDVFGSDASGGQSGEVHVPVHRPLHVGGRRAEEQNLGGECVYVRIAVSCTCITLQHACDNTHTKYSRSADVCIPLRSCDNERHGNTKFRWNHEDL